MIAETEHFILDYRKYSSNLGQNGHMVPESGLVIKIKNKDNTTTDVLYILPNKQIKFMERPGTYLETNGKMLQDSITSWELFVELVKLIDEADWRVDPAAVPEDFNSYLN